ncbi:MAG: DUF3472 domain-containing protein [Tannerellaceae bacterium]|jgi:hypothetical protein|nr:DUF3472 domain-containing protein [Tannerellaceae bacterium]
MTKNLSLILLILLLGSCRENRMQLPEDGISVPVAGNTYVTEGMEGAKISNRGEINSWTQPDALLSTWFKVSNPGKLQLFLKTKPVETSSTVEVSLLGKSFTVKIGKTEEPVFHVGTVTVTESGYIRVDAKGLKKETSEFPFITEYLIAGEAAAEPLHFVRDFETYWGLRGPSVHMSYALPEGNVEYFYNEITVPEGEDKTGSYFMTNGFGEGYCGIQVNSEKERRVLFSVWSPFSTDNPDEIPENQRIKLLAQGEGVHIGEFGNEGSGGQSYLIYPWKAGETYKVITRVHPDGKGNTEYYAWFYAPEDGSWKLIAGFLRPQTNTWYKRAHSFLENFIPGQGYLERKVYFKNQWVRTEKGDWIELTEGVFTNDATARAGVRMDYAGGVEGDAFFLKNGGFFNDCTEYKSVFTRQPKGIRPQVDTFL